MAEHHRETSPSQPRPVPGSLGQAFENESNIADSDSRAASTARLASIPSSMAHNGVAASRQAPTPSQVDSETQTPLPGVSDGSFSPGPGRSALAAALEGHYGRSPPSFGTPARPLSPPAETTALPASEAARHYSLSNQSPDRGSEPSSRPIEDPEIIKRHLVLPTDEDSLRQRGSSTSVGAAANQPAATTSDEIDAPDLDEFSSLQLQGGDTTRAVYRWAEEADAQSTIKGKRSKSFVVNRPDPENDELDIQSIKAPGGFRRNYLRRSGASPAGVGRRGYSYDRSGEAESGVQLSANQPRIFTNNFIEFLTLYGHFAGEELEDDDDDDDIEDYFSDGYGEGDMDGARSDERTALLTPKTPRTPGGRRRPRKPRSTQGQNTPWGAALLLLKSFVGTGVLFLPRAFLNGGMLFSSLVLLGVSLLSYYCFILLVNTRLRVNGSFGEIGGILYGPVMRNLILGSIVLSQIGFVAAYIVFTSENLQAFIIAVSHCATKIDIKFMVLMQLILFLPLSLIRDISKLGFTALIADAFIMLGLIYLYYFDISTIISNKGPADIIPFNPNSWTLFIGTAIFTFEGIGLIVPIQESMRNPQKFPPVLAVVMVIITIIFTSMGALSYAAFGSKTKTVVLLNLPQDNKFVNGVQFLYSLAILLSTPLQLFPAIRILETGIFTAKSGKNNPWIKWQKNFFRFMLVMFCALIAWAGAGDLDKFVALVGSFACVPLVNVYPVSHRLFLPERKSRS